MDPSGYLAQGTVLRIGDGATPTEAFTDIEGCDDFSGPGESADTIETTSHSSPGHRRQYIGGLINSGELTFDVFWIFVEPGQLALQAAFNDGLEHNFQMEFPVDTTDNLLSFAGIVTGMEWAVPKDDAVKKSVTIQITGPVSESDAA